MSELKNVLITEAFYTGNVALVQYADHTTDTFPPTMIPEINSRIGDQLFWFENTELVEDPQTMLEKYGHRPEKS
jgi:hypothetical protein